MLRFWIAVLLAVALGVPSPFRAQAATPLRQVPESKASAKESRAVDQPILSSDESFDDSYPQSLEDFAVRPGFSCESCGPETEYVPLLKYLGLRHLHTHGRYVGRGGPLVDSSWLNRPYYAGAELGTLWLTRPIDDDVTRDVDAFGGVYLGWDRDPYWGAELRFDWATPELINRDARDADRTDSLFMWSYNLMYYPWGDAKWRPYWRAGIGDTRFDFPLDDGSRHDQWMLTFPVGVGVKYPLRRWLAARADLTDHMGVGHGRLNAQHNLSLTFGLEWHFGAHPRSYWPWNPDRHIW